MKTYKIRTKDGIDEFEYQFGETKSKIFKDIAQNALENTIASFKQKNRIIRQRWNKYLKPVDGKLSVVKQEGLNKTENYNIRKRLHEDTFYGKVKLQNNKNTTKNVVSVSLKKALEEGYDLYDTNVLSHINKLKEENNTIQDIIEQLKKIYPKVDVYEKFVATRFGNELESFASISPDKIIKTIQSITDTGVQRILKKHLINYDTITKKIEEINEYAEFVVDDEHRSVLKDLLKTDSKIEYLTVDKKVVKETEIFIKNIHEVIDEKLIKHNPQLAFSYDGVKEMNNNIITLNNGRFHHPIYKVRTADALGTKFSVSEKGQKSTKYVVTAAGSNAFCGFYQKGNDRKFYIPTLRESVQNLKYGFEPCPVTHPDDSEFKLTFVLNPSDLVYIPTEEEIENPNLVDFNKLNKDQINRIYKFTDGSGTIINFIPVNIATVLFNLNIEKQKKAGIDLPIQNEVGVGSQASKNQNSLDGIQIKSTCWKLKIDRLGNISKA